MSTSFKSGFFVGTGAATSIEVGFIPDVVSITNLTDGDTSYLAFPGVEVIPFTSGGTNTVKAGHTIVDATSLATALVRQVILSSGTWAGGDAAGWFIIEAGSRVGAFGSHNIYYQGSSTINDATVTIQVEEGIVITTAAASDTGTSGYTGVAATTGLGFTVSSANSESGKLWGWAAWRMAD